MTINDCNATAERKATKVPELGCLATSQTSMQLNY